MRRVVTTFVLVALLCPVLLSVGCAPQDRYDELMTAYRAQAEQLELTSTDLEQARANEEALRNQLMRVNRDLQAIEGERNDLVASIDTLESDYSGLATEVDTLRFGPLPARVEAALQQLAAQHGNLMTFDASRGMLRFSSDVSFGLGSTDLSAGAAQSIGALASILSSSDAQGFEVQIVGHTDNVPISRPATRAKHPTNVHLSAHRAIAVRDALVKAGVAGERIMVGGYGATRPIVQNGPSGAAANRRVEIFLVPMTATVVTVTEVDSAPAPAATGGSSNFPMK